VKYLQNGGDLFGTDINVWGRGVETGDSVGREGSYRKKVDLKEVKHNKGDKTRKDERERTGGLRRGIEKGVPPKNGKGGKD